MAESTRSLRAEDLDRVMEIERLSFSMPWSREAMEQELHNPAARYQVLEADGQVQAYAGAWLVIDEGHVTNVAVHPDARRRGYGRAVLRALIRQLMDLGVTYMTLEVRVSNEAAISLYKQLGFKRAGLRKGYYEDDREDAYIFVSDRLENAFLTRYRPVKAENFRPPNGEIM